MQITFDTATASAPELRMLQELIGELYRRATSLAAASHKAEALATVSIGYADHPDTGLNTNTPPSMPPIPPVPPVAGAIERDARGFPWDERLHSSTRKKSGDGTWQWKRGVANDRALITRIEAELLSTLPGAAPGPQAVAPVFPQAPAVAPQVPLPPTVAPTTPTAPPVMPAPAANLPPAPPVPPLPPVPPVSPAPSLPPAPSAQPVTPTSLQELIAALQPAMLAGKVTADTITAACMMAGVATGLPGLTTAAPEVIGKVWAHLQPSTV